MMKKPAIDKSWKSKLLGKTARASVTKAGRKSVTLPSFSWDGGKDGGVQEQKTNGK